MSHECEEMNSSGSFFHFTAIVCKYLSSSVLLVVSIVLQYKITDKNNEIKEEKWIPQQQKRQPRDMNKIGSLTQSGHPSYATPSKGQGYPLAVWLLESTLGNSGKA